MRFAVCNELFQEWSFDDVCAYAAKIGYEGVEIAPFTLGESVLDLSLPDRARVRDAAQRNCLEIVGLHWLLVKPAGLYINHMDQSIVDMTLDYLKAEIDFCADVGGKIMVVGSPKQRNILPGQTYEATWDRTVKAFKRLAPHAASRDVCLCIEALSTEETNFLNTAEEGRRLVSEVNHPSFQMMLDVKAMCSDSEPIPDIIRKTAPVLRHVHANDANRQGPGFGRTDFRPIAVALRETDYDGWVSVEVFDFSAGPDRIASESISYLKKTFAE